MNEPARAIAAALIGVAVALAGATQAHAQRATGRAFLSETGKSRIKGSTDAPVTVYEIADFQCPFCARFAERVMPQIDSAYIETGKVRWVFINFPLPNHRNAWVASEAALCAGGIADRFWALHDRLFSEQQEWSEAAAPAELFVRYARAAGVPVEPFRACTAADRVAPVLTQDIRYATRIQVSGTPTFIIGRRERVVGVKTFSEWQELLDAALEEATSGDT